jgi:hypothetical protein
MLLFVCAALTAATSAQAQSADHPEGTSSWVFFGKDHRLEYKTDSQGNRIMDFSYAGYRGGGVALPWRVPVEAVVTPVAGHNTQNIQSAIDTVSARAIDSFGLRGVVLLTPGNYEVDGSIGLHERSCAAGFRLRCQRHNHQHG